MTEPWQTELSDSDVGPVTLSGRYLSGNDDEVLVCLHGLGGSTDSGYMALMLRAAERARLSCLLLNSRGADRSGSDIYHSGLSVDIEAALKSPVLASAKRIHLFGYSIGGHISLSYACGQVDPRVTKVCAVGSPLHLASAADDFDAARFNVYRSHVMDSLKEIYTAAYQRNPSGIEPIEARKIQTIRQWDERVIAPRFGFDGAAHYYQTQSVGPRLSSLNLDALYIGAVNDPMVRAGGVAPYLDAARLKSVWCPRGGHLGFAQDFEFGQAGPAGLEDQVIAWFRS